MSRPPSRRRALARRFAVGAVAAATVAAGSLLAVPPSAHAADNGVALSVNYPSTVTANSSPTSFTASASNSTSSPIPRVRYDIAVTGDPGLTADEITLQYESSPGSGQYLTAPLSGTTASGGTITGYFGPEAGFTFPATTILTTSFHLSVAAGAPAGTISEVVTLDQLPDGSGTPTTLATSSGTTTIAPAASLSIAYPTAVTAGSAPVAFTGSATNNSDQDLTGARYDIALTGPAGLAASDVTLTYTPQGSETTYPVPLSGSTGAGGITGYFGPQTGFVLPASVTATTGFHLSIADSSYAGTLADSVALVQVDGSGTVVDTVATSSGTTVVSPTASLTVGVPSVLVTSAQPTSFTATAVNHSDQPINGVRYDVVLSGDPGLTAGQITLTYEPAGSSTYLPVPLSGSTAGGGTITGYFGPQAGFTFPASASSTTPFRIAISGGAPAGTLTAVVHLDTVDGEGTVQRTLATSTTTTAVESDYEPLSSTRILSAEAVPAGTTYALTLPAAVPSDAGAIALNVTAVRPATTGNLRIQPVCGTSRTSTSLVNFQPGIDTANFVVLPLQCSGTSAPVRTVDISSDGSAVTVDVDLVGTFPAAPSSTDAEAATYATPGFVGAGPTRVVDTRTGLGGVNGPLDVGSTHTFTLPNVPAGAKAVALNLTSANPVFGGFLTVYAGGQQRPPTSNLNIYPGADKADFAIVDLPSDGSDTIQVYSGYARTDVVVDVYGYVPSGASLTTLAQPVRALDTRTGSGTTQGLPSPLAANTAYAVSVVGSSTGVPATARAVVVDLTAAHAATSTGTGNLRAYPSGSTLPGTSNVNYINQFSDVANLAIVPIGPDGRIDLYSDGSPIDAIVDVVGYVPGPTPQG